MLTVVAVTYLTYALAIARGITFFRQPAECREADKHIVGSLVAGSVLFMVFQTLVWVEKPGKLFGSATLDSLWMAFNFFNAALYLTLSHLFVRNRACRNQHGHET